MPSLWKTTLVMVVRPTIVIIKTITAEAVTIAVSVVVVAAISTILIMAPQQQQQQAVEATVVTTTTTIAAAITVRVCSPGDGQRGTEIT